MTSSPFDLNLFSNFDFSQLMDSEEEQNVLRNIMPDTAFQHAADGSVDELDTPAQCIPGVTAPPPPTPFEQDMAAPQSGLFDVLEPACIFCDAPLDTDHAPDCALLQPLQPTSPAASSSPDLTVLNPNTTIAPGSAENRAVATPLLAATPALKASPRPYVSPYGPSSYPMPASMPPPTLQAFDVKPQAFAPPTQPQPAAASTDSSSGDEVAPLYQARFGSFDAARQALIPPQGADTLIKLGLENDDWQQIHVHDSANLLFDAMHAQPGPPPVNFSEEQTVYYYEHQDGVRESLLNKIHDSLDKAEARVMLLLEQVISVHEDGVPKSVWERKAIKSGYLLESDLICSQRLQDVLKAVRNDKYVAFDVLSGTGLADLARSPARYLRRKHENCRVNARKAFEKQKAEEIKRNGMPANQSPAAPASRATKKTPTGKQAAHTQGVGLSPHTPTPSMPAAPMPQNLPFHLQYAPSNETGTVRQKRKGNFDQQEILKRFKYKDGNQE